MPQRFRRPGRQLQQRPDSLHLHLETLEQRVPPGSLLSGAAASPLGLTLDSPDPGTWAADAAIVGRQRHDDASSRQDPDRGVDVFSLSTDALAWLEQQSDDSSESVAAQGSNADSDWADASSAPVELPASDDFLAAAVVALNGWAPPGVAASARAAPAAGLENDSAAGSGSGSPLTAASSVGGTGQISDPSATPAADPPAVVPAISTLAPARARGVVADSVTDFSGTQGTNNWYYGYYAAPPASSSFTLMANFTGVRWQESLAPPPWTMIWQDGGHPTGADSGTVQWSARRWISNVDDPAATITGVLAKLDGGGGDGTIGHVVVDGIEVYNHDLAYNDTTGVNYSVTVALKVGSTVDFLIDPKGTDYNDSTTFTAQITAYLPPPPATQSVVADSVADFSGTQNSHNWHYGYYATPADSSSFTELAYFDGTRWDESTSAPPWTMLWNNGGHPNGPDSGSVHWAVRRWISDVTDPAATLSGLLAKADGSGGEGTIGYVYVNGGQVWQHSLAFNDTVGVNYSLKIPIAAGATVDFVIAPKSTDYNDSTTFTAQISADPPAAPPPPDCSNHHHHHNHPWSGDGWEGRWENALSMLQPLLEQSSATPDMLLSQIQSWIAQHDWDCFNRGMPT